MERALIQVGVRQVRAFPVDVAQFRSFEDGGREVRPRHARRSEICAHEVRKGEVRRGGFGVLKIAHAHAGMAKLRALDVRLAQRKLRQVGLLEIDALEARLRDLRVAEIRETEVGPVKPGTFSRLARHRTEPLRDARRRSAFVKSAPSNWAKLALIDDNSAL